MTIRTTLLGGSDFVNGEVLNGSDLNDTFGAVTYRVKSYTNATEYTHTGDQVFTTKMSTTFGALNAVLTGIRFQCDLKSDNAVFITSARLVLSGSNLGTLYSGYSSMGVGYSSLGFFPTSTTALVSRQSLTYGTVSVVIPYPLQLLDASTTCAVQIKGNTDGLNSYIENVELDFFYNEMVYYS